MVTRGWANAYHSKEALDAAIGDKYPINKLALISKEKPDGSMNHRIIWDYKRSGVNGLSTQRERIVFPTVIDFISDTQDLSE